MYTDHPLLDPNLPSHEPGQVRRWVKVYRRLQRDADIYLDDILRHVPAVQRDFLKPRAATRALNRPASLMRACFAGTDPRERYEAQRKLYLGKLLFTIDHCRPVREGQRHKEILDAHLNEFLFSGAREGSEHAVCCRFSPDDGGGHLEFDSASAPGVRCWNFQVRKLAAAAAPF